MTVENEIAFLEQVPVLSRLGNGPLRSLAIATETVSLREGDVLFTAGEAADGAYIVQHGSMVLQPPRGGEQVVAGPGTLLGEAALLTQTLRPVAAIAREPCMVMRISRSAFLKILDSYPDAATRLREALTARADEWARDMENVRTALATEPEPEP